MRSCTVHAIFESHIDGLQGGRDFNVRKCSSAAAVCPLKNNFHRTEKIRGFSSVSHEKKGTRSAKLQKRGWLMNFCKPPTPRKPVERKQRNESSKQKDTATVSHTHDTHLLDPHCAHPMHVVCGREQRMGNHQLVDNDHCNSSRLLRRSFRHSSARCLISNANFDHRQRH